MTLGHTVREAGHMLKALALGFALLAMPGATLAAAAAAPAPAASSASAPANDNAKTAATPAAPATAAAEAPAAPAINPNDPHFKVAPGGYTPLPAVQGVGMPIPGAIDVQEQFSPTGHRAQAMHNGLIWVMVVIVAIVLILLLFVILRFNKRANPVPSKTAHNTLLEVVWTGIPILVLVAIAVPSVGLLRAQFKPASKDALTIKAVGNQWYWTYDYPDNGKIEVISNMLNEAGHTQPGQRARTDADGPEHLAVDNRMVVPVGEDIRLQTTGADVIHSFAVPSLWFKLDAVPGRLNEKVLRVEKPGVYFGQCSELCGVKHGYMPIVVEALPRDKFNAWVIAQGGTIDGAPAAAAAAPAPAPTTAAPTPAAKPAA